MSEKALAYYRTSSATNVGGDSLPRQQEAVRRYAKAHRIAIVGEFYDPAVSGADPVDQRPGFTDLLARIEGNGVRMILVENASRFARDLAVQLAGHDMLKTKGIALIPVDAPDFFQDETPTAVMVRQILGAVSQFEKAALVAKLRAARDRRSREKGRRIEGRKPGVERTQALLDKARRLARKSPKTGKARSLRQIASGLAAEGYTTASGKPFSPSQVKRLLAA
jgi:DNA invertase Pin-like site-specific DNA recombinase